MQVFFPPSPTVLNLNSINTSSIDDKQENLHSLNASKQNSLLKQCDCFRSNKTSTQADTQHSVGLSTPQFSIASDLAKEQQCNYGKTSSTGMGSVLSIKRNFTNANTMKNIHIGTNTTQPLNSSTTDFFGTGHDLRNSKTTAKIGTNPEDKPVCLKPQYTSNTILTTSKGNESRTKWHQGKRKPPKTHWHWLRQDPNKHSLEGELNRGGSTISPMK